MSRHDEWNKDLNKGWNKTGVEIYNHSKGKRYEMLVDFERGGYEILRPRVCEEDDDFPEFMGESILGEMGTQALERYGISDGSIKMEFMEHEKGMLSVYFIDTK